MKKVGLKSSAFSFLNFTCKLEFELSNVEWVDLRFNRIKFDLTPDEFFNMATTALVRRFKSKLGPKLTAELKDKLNP